MPFQNADKQTQAQVRRQSPRGQVQVKPLDQKRRHYLAIWVNESERGRIIENASRCAIPVSVFCRSAALQEVIRPAPSPELVIQLRNLALLGSNLNQISHNLNSAALSETLTEAVTRKIGDIQFIVTALAEVIDDTRRDIVRFLDKS